MRLVDALIRDVKARQEMVKALMIEEEEAKPLPFVGSSRQADGVNAVLTAIKSTLAIDTSTFRSPKGGFAYLRDSAERAGIFVLLMGNLGSHHTNIDIELFRGFSLADEIAPFVVINDQDHEAAWAFTLLHELTHIWLGQTGVSGSNGQTALERFCDSVAAEFLLPEQERSTRALVPTQRCPRSPPQ